MFLYLVAASRVCQKEAPSRCWFIAVVFFGVVVGAGVCVCAPCSPVRPGLLCRSSLRLLAAYFLFAALVPCFLAVFSPPATARVPPPPVSRVLLQERILRAWRWEGKGQSIGGGDESKFAGKSERNKKHKRKSGETIWCVITPSATPAVPDARLVRNLSRPKLHQRVHVLVHERRLLDILLEHARLACERLATPDPTISEGTRAFTLDLLSHFI